MDLPFVDEHCVVVAAPAATVWRALAVELPRFTSAGPLMHILGTDPRRAQGADPTIEGATLPGFAVAQAVAGRRLHLTGRHRFSSYALTLTLENFPEGTRLCATTHAAFPGPHGRAYRLLVIGSGAHRVAVTRLLRAVRRRASLLG